MNKFRAKFAAHRRAAIASSFIAFGLCATPALVHSQTATIYGSIGNFDIANNTGENACGFEIELEGTSARSNLYGWPGNRFGAPSITPYSTAMASGMRIRWASNDCATNKTIAHPLGTPFGGTCYQWYPASYPTAGCEHFGVANYAGATKITSRWLVNDPANPGTFVPRDPPEAIPYPVYTVQPAIAPNAAPVIVAEVQAPEPPQVPTQFGNAQWMKVFVRQLPRAVTLDELVSDNPLVVPMDPALIEINWTVMQSEPLAGGTGTRTRSRNRAGSTLDPTTRTVVRRYEFYAYTGAYDPVSHKVLCADLTCTAPAIGELGDFISAQMAAVNVQGDFVTVTKSGTGGGNVDSADKAVTCGNKCVSPYLAGTAVNLTAKANSGSIFVGWTGVCTGAGNCIVTVNGANDVGARFDALVAGGGGVGGGGTATVATATYTLSIGRSNSGSVSSDVGGISCGSTCSAKYNAGSVVVLTAVPPAGKTFANWSNACSGTAPTCALTVNGNLTAQANFNK